MKKGGIYTGYVESVDFPNKGNVVVRTEEDGQVIEEGCCKEFHTGTDS